MERMPLFTLALHPRGSGLRRRQPVLHLDFLRPQVHLLHLRARLLHGVVRREDRGGVGFGDEAEEDEDADGDGGREGEGDEGGGDVGGVGGGVGEGGVGDGEGGEVG